MFPHERNTTHPVRDPVRHHSAQPTRRSCPGGALECDRHGVLNQHGVVNRGGVVNRREAQGFCGGTPCREGCRSQGQTTGRGQYHRRDFAADRQSAAARGIRPGARDWYSDSFRHAATRGKGGGNAGCACPRRRSNRVRGGFGQERGRGRTG